MKTILSILFLGLLAFSSPNVAIFGILQSYDKDNAVIQVASGTRFKVPKVSLATSVDGLITGKAQVIASLTVEQLSELNPKVFPKASSK